MSSKDQSNRIFKAVGAANSSAVRATIEEGTPVDIADSRSGWTPLMLAIFHGYGSVISTLLQLGASVNAKDKQGNTSLHHAVVLDAEFCIIELVQNGADVNAKNNRQETPLDVAYIKKSYHCPMVLRELGARLEEMKIFHTTKIDRAIIWFDKEARLLSSIERSEVNIVKQALEAGANPNIRYPGQYGIPVLQRACINGNYDIVSLLLQHDAKVDIQTEAGITALMSASLYNHVSIAELLLSYGADKNKTNLRGETAITIALNGKNKDLCRLLQAE